MIRICRKCGKPYDDEGKIGVMAISDYEQMMKERMR